MQGISLFSARWQIFAWAQLNGIYLPYTEYFIIDRLIGLANMKLRAIVMHITDGVIKI